MLGYFVWKITILRQKIIFFPILGGRTPGARPPGSAPGMVLHLRFLLSINKDEYVTAAYKTVELDTYLDDVPIQHREVQGHESKLFKSYFNTVT